FRFHFHPFLQTWMKKTELFGMQSLTLEPFLRTLGAIKRIAHQRMTNILHMYRYLMCSTCLQSTINPCMFSEAFFYLKMGYGWLSILIHFHPLSVNGIASNGSFNGA